jgi:hypothetical protein
MLTPFVVSMLLKATQSPLMLRQNKLDYFSNSIYKMVLYKMFQSGRLWPYLQTFDQFVNTLAYYARDKAGRQANRN